MQSENQYPAKIHNQVLKLFTPFRLIKVSDIKINNAVKPLSVEMYLDKPFRISEINIGFSQKTIKDVIVYFRINNEWKKIVDLNKEGSLDLTILIEPDKRDITPAVKIEFPNASSTDTPVFFKVALLLRPLR